MRVADPAKAVIEIEDYLYATSQLAQTTLRSVLGEVELDELLADREKINAMLKQIIDERTDPWGIEVSAVEVKDVDLPDQMKRAMARQAEAERERRAKVISAQGELQASETLAQAARTLATEPARCSSATCRPSPRSRPRTTPPPSSRSRSTCSAASSRRPTAARRPDRVRRSSGGEPPAAALPPATCSDPDVAAPAQRRAAVARRRSSMAEGTPGRGSTGPRWSGSSSARRSSRPPSATSAKGSRPDEVLALGKEVGIPGRYLQQAMLEERHPSRPGRAVRAGRAGVGPGGGQRAAGRAGRSARTSSTALIDWFEKQELFCGAAAASRAASPGSPSAAFRPRSAAPPGGSAPGSRAEFMLAKAELVAATVHPAGVGILPRGAHARVCARARAGYVGGRAALARWRRRDRDRAHRDVEPLLARDGSRARRWWALRLAGSPSSATGRWRSGPCSGWSGRSTTWSGAGRSRRTSFPPASGRPARRSWPGESRKAIAVSRPKGPAQVSSHRDGRRRSAAA